MNFFLKFLQQLDKLENTPVHKQKQFNRITNKILTEKLIYAGEMNSTKSLKDGRFKTHKYQKDSVWLEMQGEREEPWKCVKLKTT